MSGLELLGAVASAVQLGVLCVSATNRLCAICSDHKLAKAIHAECLSLITEIDERMLTLTSDNRIPALDLRQRLLTIQKRIERRRQRVWIIKWSGKLRLSGASDKEEVIFALHTYQTRVSLSGTATMEAIQSRVGAAGIPKEVEGLLKPIILNLVTSPLMSSNARIFFEINK
jgi:hypothetical protein